MPALRLSPLAVAASLCVAASTVAAPAFAKAPPTQQELKALWKAEDYKGLVKALGALSKENPEDGGIWLQLGLASIKAEKYAKAVEAFEQAEAHGIPPHLARYNIACAQALDGEVDAAFAALSGAMSAGFADVALLKKDTDLDALRGDKRFVEILTLADHNSRPCEFDARFAALDFWLGDWDVTNAQGHKVGENSIARIATGCAVRESWTGLYGPNGQSLSFFDPSTDAWRQSWVSDGGGLTLFDTGAAKDGRFVFEGDAVGVDGTVQGSRMTLVPNDDGTVTQIGERAKDGDAWMEVFRLTYTRKATP